MQPFDEEGIILFGEGENNIMKAWLRRGRVVRRPQSGARLKQSSSGRVSSICQPHSQLVSAVLTPLTRVAQAGGRSKSR